MQENKSYQTEREKEPQVVSEPMACYAHDRRATHFAVMAIEAAAAKSNISPMEMHRRLERVDLIGRLLYGHYDTMHTLSIDHVADDVITALHNWEARYEADLKESIN